MELKNGLMKSIHPAHTKGIVLLGLVILVLNIGQTAEAMFPTRRKLQDVTYKGVHCKTYIVDLRPIAQCTVKWYFSKKYKTIVYIKVTDDYENTISRLENIIIVRR